MPPSTMLIFKARIDGRRRCEESHPVSDLDDIIVSDLSVGMSGDDLEKIAIRTDGRHRQLPQFPTRHVFLGDRVVDAVNLNLKLPRLRPSFDFVRAHSRLLLVRVWYQDTKAPHGLTTKITPVYNRVMKPEKAMTIRLSSEQAQELETVARVDDQSVTDVIRAAIAEHIERRKRDAKFKAGLKERIELAQRMLGEKPSRGG